MDGAEGDYYVLTEGLSHRRHLVMYSDDTFGLSNQRWVIGN